MLHGRDFTLTELGREAVVPFVIKVSEEHSVSAILTAPSAPVCYVMAHGAGAGMTHRFMATMADGLADRRIAVLRFQFPFMQNGSKRPDPPRLAHATVRAAVAEAARRMPAAALIAGGKSFGGRMTSQTQAADPMPHVVGLAFTGFPLHPAGKPSAERAQHLAAVAVPMLFLQGTRDALADLSIMIPIVSGLGSLATLKVIDGADHAFHVLARSGRTDIQAMTELLDVFAAWASAVAAAHQSGS